MGLEPKQNFKGPLQIKGKEKKFQHPVPYVQVAGF